MDQPTRLRLALSAPRPIITSRLRAASLIQPIPPESLDPIGPASERYDLLGYDVADYDLLGGLANCGYTPGGAASLAPVWAPLLNEWHLFGNPEDAMAYAAVTAKRVPEHAPFFGYGIYQLV